MQAHGTRVMRIVCLRSSIAGWTPFPNQHHASEQHLVPDPQPDSPAMVPESSSHRMIHVCVLVPNSNDTDRR